MVEVMNVIGREDIYNIIIPIAIVIIGWVPGGIKVFLDADRYWKCLKKTSAQNEYFKFFWGFYSAGLWIMILFCLFSVAIMISLQKILSPDTIKNSYLVFSVLCHIALIYIVRKSLRDGKEFAYKKSYKFKPLMTWVLTWSPIITSILIWDVLWKWNFRILSFMTVILCLIVELLAFALLDDKSTMEFDYATFYLNDDIVISDADTDISYQKGNWIIAKYKDSEKEIRFRRKDVKRIYYSNQKDES